MKLFQLCISLLLTHVIGFTPLISNKPFLTSVPSSVSSLSATSGATEEETERFLLDDLRKMRVKELMQELKSAGLRTDDVFEKEELVKRLAEFRSTLTASNKKPSTTSQPQQERRRTTRTEDNIIAVPLHFYSLEGSRAVEARNSKDIFIRPSPGKFATITLYLNNNSNSKLTMLVDTACSGVVLRPSSVKKHGLPMQSTNGVSMTSAGGTATGYGLSQLQKFTLEDGSEFRSLPVAVQDIGALPSAIDGIIGLSFLNQFGSVMFDFSNSELLLYNKGNNQDTYSFTTENNLELITESKMQMCKLGIWATECTLDGRGPVKMLVDTGAASTFLNWNGVSDLNMSNDHPLISRNVNMGAMGADNNALALTHRFVLKSRFKLGGIGDTENMFLPGLEVNTLDGSAGVASSSSPSSSSNVAIDIGDLPVLATLSTEKVNGILGSDILMRADVVLLNLDRSNLKLSLFSKRN